MFVRIYLLCSGCDVLGFGGEVLKWCRGVKFISTVAGSLHQGHHGVVAMRDIAAVFLWLGDGEDR